MVYPSFFGFFAIFEGDFDFFSAWTAHNKLNFILECTKRNQQKCRLLLCDMDNNCARKHFFTEIAQITGVGMQNDSGISS